MSTYHQTSCSANQSKYPAQIEKRWISTYPSLLVHPSIQGAADLIKTQISTTAIHHHPSSPHIFIALSILLPQTV